MPNPIVHFEIGVKDIQAGMGFYKDIFGWDISHDPDMNYVVIDTGDDPGGGIFGCSEAMPTGVYIYVKVDDIGDSLKKAEELGGKIIKEKTQVSEEHGYFALFSDPDGNAIGIWSKT